MDNFSAKQLAWWSARVLLLYATLMAPWPGLRESYATAFRMACRVFAGTVGPGGHVVVRPASAENLFDTTIQLARIAPETVSGVARSSNGVMRTRVLSLDARSMGYIPTALLVALILGTPLVWQRRWSALAWGIVSVNAFIASQIASSIYMPFAVDPHIALVRLGPLWTGSLRHIARLQAAGITSVVATFLIWIVVSFRRGDWPLLLRER